MSDDGTSARLKELLDLFNAAVQEKDLQHAANLLKDAATLDPNNASIKDAWKKLEAIDAKQGSVALMREYVVGKNEETGKAAIKALESEELTPKDAQEVLDTLLSASTQLQSVDKLLGTCLRRKNAQTILATMLKENVTVNFTKLWHVGDESLTGLTTTLLAPAAWSNEEDRQKAEYDVCTLCLAKIIEPGTDQPETALGIVARLMAVDAHRLASLIDKENFEIMLDSMEIQKPVVLRSQATLATAKYLEADPEIGAALLKGYVVSRIGSHQTDQLVFALSAAGAIFPLVPQMASSLFLSSGFAEQLVGIVRKSKSKRLHRAALELLSAACLDKACRNEISQQFRPWLRDMARESDNDANSATAALVLSKTLDSAGATPQTTDELLPLFQDLMIVSDQDAVRSSVEGLAYTSNQPSVKEKLANDERFLKKLVKVLSEENASGPLLFGGLTVISNLTAYAPPLSAEQKRMAQLKAYANQSQPSEPDPLDNDTHVSSRCTKLLAVDSVPLLVKCSKKATPTTLNLISSIIFSLSKTKAHRGKLVQQGALDLVISLSDMRPSEDPILQSVKRTSAMALSQILTTTDPTLVFNNRPIESAIRSLHTLLIRSDGSETSATPFGPDDSTSLFVPFEAIRAITNLASYSDRARSLILARSLDAIVGWLWGSASALTQASTEAITNLCLSHDTVVKLVSAEYKQNLQLLLALTNDKAKGTRHAAGAAWVHMTVFEEGVQTLKELKGGVDRIVEMSKEQDQGMKLRGEAVLENLKASGPDARKLVEEAEKKIVHAQQNGS